MCYFTYVNVIFQFVAHRSHSYIHRSVNPRLLKCEDLVGLDFL